MRKAAISFLLSIAALTMAPGSILFADLLVSRGALGVERYTNSGTFLGTIIAPGSGGLVDAQGAAVSPAGEIFVGDFANDNILRYDASGNFLNVFASGVAVDTPFDVVFGTGGNLFVASAGPDSNITRLDQNTGAVITANFTSGNVSPIGGPQYLEFGPALAITDIAGRLFRFDPSTGVHISTSFFDNPEGVAYNAAGDLFVAQRISDNVLRLPAGGGPAQIVLPNGAFSGAPADMEIGPDGLLYLSADRIYRFDVSGPVGVLVDSFGNGGEFITFVPAAVPEPGTIVLMGAGLIFLIAKRIRV